MYCGQKNPHSLVLSKQQQPGKLVLKWQRLIWGILAKQYQHESEMLRVYGEVVQAERVADDRGGEMRL